MIMTFKSDISYVILIGLLLSSIKQTSNMNWALYRVCQQPSNEVLKCPLNGPGMLIFYFSGMYFQGARCATSVYDSCNGACNMVFNEAKWHISCYNKLGLDKLDRARKR